MGFTYIPAASTAEEFWAYLQSLADVEGSMGELTRMGLGERVTLQEHFDAITILELAIDYTVTVVGGGGAGLYLDDLPSAIRLESGGGGGDSCAVTSDQTISALSLGQQTVIAEARLKISNEAQILFTFGLDNNITNTDRVFALLDTAGGAPVNDGVLQTVNAGVAGNVDANLVSGLDLTLYHIYRLEYVPGTSARLYVDDALRAETLIVANIPPDQMYALYFSVQERGGGNRDLDIDYYKVWSE